MKIIFMGRKKYSTDLIEWTINQGIEIEAVVTDSHFSNSPTAKKAKELQIPVISMEEVEKILSQPNHDIDLVVSYLFWRKIKEPLISEPKYGCINFHPAILPDWRGTAGYNVAIINKLSEWGATAHYVDKSIDTGNIIKTYKFNFDYRLETAQSLEKKTQEIQVELYKSIILDVKEKGKIDSLEQFENEGTYISRNEMEAMKQIDIEKDDVDLKIQAFWFPPYNGAYIEIKGEKYTLVNEFILKQLVDKDSTSNA
ncbi:formyltransferase family protein [Marinisporobacter balticus]|uniref:Methionyl-tRNA formyltransferase n=1 Tax=Marinisporobacter balticus TaxID=2018667 RepID=A0A4R2KWB9_9FIRM|nr:formyltransferase family protein [Marinisporobacter balticus]TCO78821.1 methionyl-tRNA formyltransferase [Marinisporobacter balticus]